MPRFDPLKTSFNSGEFSKEVFARTNFERYPDAAEVMRNLIPLPQGGMSRRPGTHFVTNTKNNGATRLIPFSFSTAQAYQIGLFDGGMWVFRNQGQITVPTVSATITNGTFDANISGWSDQSAGTGSISWDAGNARMSVTGAGSGNEGIAQQAITITETGTVHVLRFTTHSNTASSVRVYVGSTAGAGDLLAETEVQDGFHTVSFTPSGSPAYLRFEQNGTGTVGVDDVSIRSNESLEVGSPYAVADLDGVRYAQSEDVLWLVHPSYWPRKIERRGTFDWSLSRYRPTANPFGSANNYPSVVTFFEQRIWFANTVNDPQKIWASVSGDFEDLTDGTADGDGFNFTISTGQVNAIQWMTSSTALLVGTRGGEFAIVPDGPQLTPTDKLVRRQSAHGSANIEPAQIGTVTAFVQAARRKIRRLQFVWEVDGYQADDLTILADHVTQSQVKVMAWQEEPDAILWCLRNDGILAGLTFRPEERVIGWHRHKVGGSFDGGHAVVESIAVIPGGEAAGSEERDELWMVVKRTVNSATVRHIEYLTGRFEGPLRDDYTSDSAWKTAVIAAQQDAEYSDSCLTYSGVSTTTISGLDHLEGETVKVLADGEIRPDRTVSSGSITLEVACTKAQVGLPYTSRFKSLKFPGGNPAGTGVGKVKRIDHLTFILVDSSTFQTGRDSDNLNTIEFREVSDAMDTAVPLFDGEKRHDFAGDYDRDARYEIVTETPLPLTVLGVAPEMAVNKA